MTRIAYIPISVLILAGCKPATPHPAAVPEPAPQAATPPPAAEPAVLPLTPEGWGSLKVGASEKDVRAALAPFEVEGDPTDESYKDCHHINSKVHPGLAAMIQDGRLTRLSLWSKSDVKTDKALGVGATEAQVKAAYGSAIKVTPHHYEGPLAHYLTAFDPKTQRGVRYETNDKGIVTTIHAGDGSIELVEGCS
jgi:hypothetical protein